MITEFLRSAMKPQEEMDREKYHRLAEDSIMSAQKVDEYTIHPEQSIYRHLQELETVAGPMYGAVIAEHKMGPKLHASSFHTAKSYNDDYKARRDELFAEIAKEKEASS